MLILKKYKKLCALDPSLNGSALAFFKDNELIDYYFFTSTQKFKDDKHAILLPKLFDDDIHRLITIKRLLVEKIFNYKIDYFAIEGYADSKSGKESKVFTIGGFIEGIKEKVYEVGIPMRIYEPTRIKKFITGNGNASKSDMAVCCLKKYNQDFTYYGREIAENLVDAYCIGRLLNFELLAKEDESILVHEPKYVTEIFLKTKDDIPLIKKSFIKKK